MEINGSTSQPFLLRVAQDVVTRFGKDLRKVAIVFNNQRPAYYLKNHLASLQDGVFWSPQFFTVQDFFRLSSSRGEINQNAQIFLLNDLHTVIQREQNPAFEESLDHFFPIAEIILNDFAQLDYELVDVDTLFQELKDISVLDRQFDFLTEEQQSFLHRFWAAFSHDQHSEMQERFLQLWRILPRLYRDFKSALLEEGSQTMAGIYRDLAENQAGLKDISANYKQILFVGFNALNASESTIFKRWQEQRKALFYFDADQYYFEDTLMEAGYFIRQNMGSHGLINALGEHPDRLSVAVRPEQSVRLISAPGKTAQAKALPSLLEEIDPMKSTAILLADESLLLPVLQSIPDHIQEVNITMGYPMTESFTYSFLDLFLSFQLQYAGIPIRESLQIDYDLVVNLIGHPFSGCPADKKLLLQQELARFQSPVLPVSVVKALFADHWTCFPGYLNRAAHVAELMETIQELLSELYYQDLTLAKGRVELVLIEESIQAFRQLQQGFNNYSSLSIALAVKLIRRVMGRITATLRGDRDSGLQVMGLLESRNLNFDVIYLLGANEGILPVRQAAPSFIPYNLRRAYGLPVLENQDSLSAYLFYRLFHHFERIDLIYNGEISNQNTGEVTRFAKQLQYESNLVFEKMSIGIASTNTTDQSNPHLQVLKTDEVWERLTLYLKEAPKEKRRYLSASAFATYLNSPLEFFLKYIAGIKEAPNIQTGIQSNRLGTVIHHVMELAYKPFMEQDIPVTQEHIAVLLEQLPDLCMQAVRAEFLVKPPDGAKGEWTERGLNSHERIILRLAEEYCKLFLQHDQQLGGSFLLQELENEEDYLLEFPIEVNGQANSVILKGIIDRVDVIDSESADTGRVMRIVDYKTGGDILEVRKTEEQDGKGLQFFDRNWEHSNKAFIQTLFYTYIYEQVSGYQGIEPHLYSIRRIRSGETHFRFKPVRKPAEPIVGSVLQEVKADFVQFLKRKLEELFDPEIPFVHPAEATVYEQSPYTTFLSRPINFESDSDTEA